MPFPAGLPTKTLTFGRYSSALGTNRGGTIAFGFADPMYHVPTGEVIVSGDETITIEPGSGVVQVVVPVTVTEDLVSNWDTASPYYNQRLRVTVTMAGYPSGAKFLDINPADPAVMDYDTLQPYVTPGGLTAYRAAVTSWATLSGDITLGAAKTALGLPQVAGAGLTLISPDGTSYVVTVDNTGTLVVTPV